jgi:hypothetical protein
MTHEQEKTPRGKWRDGFLLFHKSFSRRADFLPEIQIVLPVTCVSELMIKKLSRLTLNCAHRVGGKRGLIA